MAITVTSNEISDGTGNVARISLHAGNVGDIIIVGFVYTANLQNVSNAYFERADTSDVTIYPDYAIIQGLHNMGDVGGGSTARANCDAFLRPPNVTHFVQEFFGVVGNPSGGSWCIAVANVAGMPPEATPGWGSATYWDGRGQGFLPEGSPLTVQFTWGTDDAPRYTDIDHIVTTSSSGLATYDTLAIHIQENYEATGSITNPSSIRSRFGFTWLSLDQCLPHVGTVTEPVVLNSLDPIPGHIPYHPETDDDPFQVAFVQHDKLYVLYQNWWPNHWDVWSWDFPQITNGQRVDQISFFDEEGNQEFINNDGLSFTSTQGGDIYYLVDRDATDYTQNYQLFRRTGFDERELIYTFDNEFTSPDFRGVWYLHGPRRLVVLFTRAFDEIEATFFDLDGAVTNHYTISGYSTSTEVNMKGSAAATEDSLWLRLFDGGSIQKLARVDINGFHLGPVISDWLPNEIVHATEDDSVWVRYLRSSPVAANSSTIINGEAYLVDKYFERHIDPCASATAVERYYPTIQSYSPFRSLSVSDSDEHSVFGQMAMYGHPFFFTSNPSFVKKLSSSLLTRFAGSLTQPEDVDGPALTEARFSNLQEIAFTWDNTQRKALNMGNRFYTLDDQKVKMIHLCSDTIVSTSAAPPTSGHFYIDLDGPVTINPGFFLLMPLDGDAVDAVPVDDRFRFNGTNGILVPPGQTEFGPFAILDVTCHLTYTGGTDLGNMMGAWMETYDAEDQMVDQVLLGYNVDGFRTLDATTIMDWYVNPPVTNIRLRVAWGTGHGAIQVSGTFGFEWRIDM